MDTLTEEAISEKSERAVSKISNTKPKIKKVLTSKVFSHDCDEFWTEVVDSCRHIERKANASAVIEVLLERSLTRAS